MKNTNKLIILCLIFLVGFSVPEVYGTKGNEKNDMEFTIMGQKSYIFYDLEEETFQNTESEYQGKVNLIQRSMDNILIKINANNEEFSFYVIKDSWRYTKGTNNKGVLRYGYKLDENQNDGSEVVKSIIFIAIYDKYTSLSIFFETNSNEEYSYSGVESGKYDSFKKFKKELKGLPINSNNLFKSSYNHAKSNMTKIVNLTKVISLKEYDSIIKSLEKDLSKHSGNYSEETRIKKDKEINNFKEFVQDQRKILKEKVELQELSSRGLVPGDPGDGGGGGLPNEDGETTYHGLFIDASHRALTAYTTQVYIANRWVAKSNIDSLEDIFIYNVIHAPTVKNKIEECTERNYPSYNYLLYLQVNCHSNEETSAWSDSSKPYSDDQIVYPSDIQSIWNYYTDPKYTEVLCFSCSQCVNNYMWKSWIQAEDYGGSNNANYFGGSLTFMASQDCFDANVPFFSDVIPDSIKDFVGEIIPSSVVDLFQFAFCLYRHDLGFSFSNAALFACTVYDAYWLTYVIKHPFYLMIPPPMMTLAGVTLLNYAVYTSL